MRAVAKDEQGEPDPQHFERFCHAIVLEMLTDVCHVGTELATQVGDDILARGESYAALDDAARNVLISPFAEEVAGYEPAASPLELKGAVAVIVRSSLLEEAHTHGPVEAGGIRGITTAAAAPLSHFLAARRRYPVPVTANQFAGLADAYPRAWACLGAVALAYGAGGGRWPYRAPAAPVPDLPAAEVEAPSASSREDAVVLSGIDTRFDQLLVEQMRERAEGGGDAVLLIASLSRISRHLGKLMRAMEYLLAHDVPILTANYLLRPREVWVRRGELATVDHRDPLAALRDPRGLSGVHRAIAAKVVKQMEADAQVAGTRRRTLREAARRAQFRADLPTFRFSEGLSSTWEPVSNAAPQPALPADGPVRSLRQQFSRYANVCRVMPFRPCYPRVGPLPNADLCCFCVGVKDRRDLGFPPDTPAWEPPTGARPSKRSTGLASGSAASVFRW